MEGETWSVYRACEQVTDGRHKRGVRSRVALLFTLMVLAKLAGRTTPRAMAEGVRRLSRVAEKGSARDASELSVRGELQHRVTEARCEAG